MSDYSTLTDAKLCKRIAKARGYVFKKVKDFWPVTRYENGELHYASAHYPEFTSDWMYTGRLFEELPAATRMQVASSPVDKLKRAICEAWLTRNEEVTK